jgi:CoA-transferase family III
MRAARLGVSRETESKAIGKELLFRLIEGADIVLENLRVGTVRKLGIDCKQRAILRMTGA